MASKPPRTPVAGLRAGYLLVGKDELYPKLLVALAPKEGPENDIRIVAVHTNESAKTKDPFYYYHAPAAEITELVGDIDLKMVQPPVFAGREITYTEKHGDIIIKHTLRKSAEGLHFKVVLGDGEKVGYGIFTVKRS